MQLSSKEEESLLMLSLVDVAGSTADQSAKASKQSLRVAHEEVPCDGKEETKL